MGVSVSAVRTNRSTTHKLALFSTRTPGCEDPTLDIRRQETETYTHLATTINTGDTRHLLQTVKNRTTRQIQEYILRVY